MSKVLFYNGLVYKEHKFQRLNVLAEDGKITHIGEWISDPEAERVDLKGRLSGSWIFGYSYPWSGRRGRKKKQRGYRRI